MKCGISHSSTFQVPGLIFFNIALCDLFFLMKDADIVNFADDNTCKSGNSTANLLEYLEVVYK